MNKLPDAIISFPGALSAEAYESIRQRIKERYSGDILILDSSLKFHKLPTTEEDAIVKCEHCGNWAARKTQCKHCGAPV